MYMQAFRYLALIYIAWLSMVLAACVIIMYIGKCVGIKLVLTPKLKFFNHEILPHYLMI